MANFKEQFKEWKSFWGEVVTMWRKEHGLTLSNCLKTSFPIAILSLIVLIYSAINDNDSWQRGSAIALGISGFIAVFNLCFIYPYKKWHNDRTYLTGELNKLADLKQLKESQLGNEQDWLHLFIEYVDIEKRNYFSEKEIYVRFNFDSGLVYDFKPYRMWITPTIGGYEAPESQYEIKQTPNLLRGK